MPESLVPQHGVVLKHRLQHLLVNVREDGHHKQANKVREFILCFQDIPVEVPVHQVLRMIEVQLLRKLQERRQKPELEAGLPLVLANAGMTMVEELHGAFHMVEFSTACFRSSGGGSQARFLTAAEGARPEWSESEPPGWCPEQPGLVDFAPPHFVGGKPQLYNLVSGDAHLFRESLSHPAKQFDLSAATSSNLVYGLVEVQACLCEDLWKAYNGMPRTGANLKTATWTLFDHPQAAQGWGKTSGLVANPVEDVAVRAQVLGAPERIRNKAMQVLEHLSHVVQQAHADCSQSEAGPAAEDLREALHNALKDQKHQLLLEWHPDKSHEKEEAKLMTQLLLPLFQRIFKIIRKDSHGS